MGCPHLLAGFDLMYPDGIAALGDLRESSESISDDAIPGCGARVPGGDRHPFRLGLPSDLYPPQV